MSKLIYGLAVVFGLAAFSLTLYTLLFSPQLTLSAPVGTSVTLYTVPANAQVEHLVTSSTTTTLRLKTGTYKVLLKDGDAEGRFYASPSAFHKLMYTYEPGTPVTAQLIAQQVAYAVVPDSDGGITYLNTTTRSLASTSSTGVNSVISPQNTSATTLSMSGDALTAPHIINGNRAIVIVDSRLYLLAQNSLTPIDMAGLPSDFTSLTIGTNPLQESFVVAANNALYEYSSPTSTPQKVIDLSNGADTLALGGDEVIAYSTRMPSVSADKSAFANFAIDPIVINLTNKTQHALAQGPVTAVSVSPDGQYATIKPLAASHMELYSLKSGKSLYDTDNSDIITPLWSDNTHFLSAEGAKVWREDVTDRTATLLAIVPNETELTSLTFDPINNNYFATTYQNENDASIYRMQMNKESQ